MLLYVTTLGRLWNQRTLLMLPEHIRRRVVLVTQDHEWAAHWHAWQGEVAEVRPLPEEVRTLGATRRTVLSWREEERVVLMDDDLEFYWRPDPDDWRLRGPGPAELDQMFGEIEDALGTYAHVGVSGREGNNRYPEYAAECTRYMRMLAYRTDVVGVVEHGRLDGMSDFDVNLQLLRRGYPSLVFYRWAQGHETTQAEGGCSTQRSHRRHEWEARQLRYWHSPHVELTQKNNKTGGAFGTRTEVVVQWKRALEEGIAIYGRQVLPGDERGGLIAHLERNVGQHGPAPGPGDPGEEWPEADEPGGGSGRPPGPADDGPPLAAAPGADHP